MSSLKSLSKEEEEWENLSEEEKEIELYTSVLMWYNDNFDENSWTDRTQARTILNTAMKKVMADPSKEKVHSYLRQLRALLPAVTDTECIDPPPGWRQRG